MEILLNNMDRLDEEMYRFNSGVQNSKTAKKLIKCFDKVLVDYKRVENTEVAILDVNTGSSISIDYLKEQRQLLKKFIKSC